MKVAPIHFALKKYGKDISHQICHTGQHYDDKMSRVFFEDLELPEPNYYLGVGSGSHAEQTARIMVEFERVVVTELPNLVVVVGDVNSTIACSLVAAKLNVRVAHIEAGLRSFDRTMPEEINRVLTDCLSDLLFVTERSGLENLMKEGVPSAKVFHVGNVMIDSVVRLLPRADKSRILVKLGVESRKYVLVTLHRPSNVDSSRSLHEIVGLLNVLAERLSIVFPVHPRTRANLDEYGLRSKLSSSILLTEPIGYVDFLALTKNAALILTDSGGIQEESTFLGVQCITLRENTERPITVEIGTNHLVGTDVERARDTALSVLAGNAKPGRIPELWDGKASERIALILRNSLLGRQTDSLLEIN
jgi:UDP-N-acetylglucosamine 2-epimerase (non-hydrolysing)